MFPQKIYFEINMKSHASFHFHCLLPDGGDVRVETFGPDSLAVESRLSTLNGWKLIRPPAEVIYMLHFSRTDGWINLRLL